MIDIKLKNYQIGIILFCITVFALILRVLGYEHITFGYDQARDALEAMSIFTTDHIKIIGPQTDIAGLFHGPLYWYMLAPFYYFGNGNPYVAKMFLILTSLVCIPTLYYVTYKVWGNKLLGLLAATFLAVSLEAVQYARWMSNPSPALLTSLFTWYAFFLMYKKNWKGIVLFLISWPFSVQFEFFLVYQLFIFVPLIFWRFSIPQLIRQHFKLLMIAAVFCLIVLSPFIIAQVKFGFQSIKALSGFLISKGGDSAYSRNPVEFTLFLARNIKLNIVDLSDGFAVGVLVIVALGYFFINHADRKKYLFCLAWFASPVIIFAFGHHHSYFLTIGNLYALIMMVSVLLISVLSKKRIGWQVFGLGLIAVLLVVNTYRIYAVRDKQEFLFSVQDDNDLYSQIQLIKWTYAQSGNELFAINTVTNPLFINTTWAYLYDQFGRKAGGQMPAWRGAGQQGRFGEKIAYTEVASQSGRLIYLIFEPSGGIPLEYYNNYSAFEDRRSKLLSEKKFGTYMVQKRRFINEIGFDYNELINFVLSNGKSVKKQ
ncbi:MAG: phospholipid carrier-dependent glycosyltransferase [Candidatus Roizmanbacteria bacterium]